MTIEHRSSAARVNTDRRVSKFTDELRIVLAAGRGTEAICLFGKGAALRLTPRDGRLEEWLEAHIGAGAMHQLITLYAVSPCVFCRRGLEACAECDRHGHLDYLEICDECLGLGVCRCDFCNGSGLSAIDTVPEGLRVPVAMERAASAVQQVETLVEKLPVEPMHANPVDRMKEQAALILRLNGLLGSIENELGGAHDLPWWTMHSPQVVSRLVGEWPSLVERAEARICAAFGSMARSAAGMENQLVEGSHARTLAGLRARFFREFQHPEKLDRTEIDHPVLDRVLASLGPTADPGERGTATS